MSASLAHFLAVAAGGAIGAGGRHLVNQAALRLMGPSFPWGTLIVNITGCFLMGVLVGGLFRLMPGGAGQGLRLFLATGVLGGFTTFSAFSLDVATLWERGAVPATAAYVAASVAGAILSIFAGMWLMRGIAP